ncbi:MAG: tetratricopeptide repeat protein [Vicingaceae bacterium]
MKQYLFHFFLLICFPFFSVFCNENKKVDSLKMVIESSSSDSSKINALNKLSWEYMYSKPDTTKIIARSAIKLWKKPYKKSLLVNSINDLATSFAVKGEFDSSLVYFNKAKDEAKNLDNRKLKAMVQNNIGLVYWNQGKLDLAVDAYDLALIEYSNLTKKTVDIANIYNNLGLIHNDRGDFDQAIESFRNAITIFDSLETKSRGVANTYNNIGRIYKSKGNLPFALDHYLKALKLLEDIEDESDAYANVLTNIGNIYNSLDQNEKALEYYEQSKAALELTSNKSNALANVRNNIGDIYKKKGDFHNALANFNAALAIQEELGEQTVGMSESLRNIGKIKVEQRKFDEGEFFFKKSISIQRALGDKEGIARSLQFLGALEIEKKQLSSAIKKCKESLEIASKLGLLQIEREACDCLSDAYEQKGNTAQAFKYYRLYIAKRDSLINQEKTRVITQKAMRYEFDKIQYQDSLNRAAETKKQELLQREKDLKQEAAIQRQRSYTIIGGIGFLFMLGLAFVLFKGYKNKQKANEIITAQKEEVEEKNIVIEEKNREIVDSINYAKRIQNTILPSEKTLAEFLPNSFVLFQPKDIVSGDFYWLDQKDDYVFFAAVDCTGHGVPGALVSVVGHNGLNRVLKEFDIYEPANMLDKLNELVEDTFSQSNESIKDGMDIALCRLNRKTNELVFAGANNPLYIVRKAEDNIDANPLPSSASRQEVDNSTHCLFEIKADKQPIGKYEYRTSFKSHSVQLTKGDSLYIFSDGYADQFGGKKGKKFMYKPFKRLITELAGLKMRAQEKKLFYAFDKWKGDLEQIDDVCVMGVRI